MLRIKNIPAAIMMFVFLYTSVENLRAQEPEPPEDWCLTIVDEDLTLEEATPYGSPEMLEGFVPPGIRHINLTIHVVRYSNGTGGILQTTINTAIQQLNSAFSSNSGMIEFTIVGSTDYILDGFPPNSQNSLLAVSIQHQSTNRDGLEQTICIQHSKPLSVLPISPYPFTS